ncbi:DUF2147 domain-containing protein [Enterovirga sp.]|uniref:DUF2147 domain-containing protein n=1 Tax=Enterovirga sp. TaxID=2026350 RepID=UPI002CF2DD73|nr:DUF2147 domain-containing protein [Enterovirga sp.]HMO30566.1 DUF2147 domain-containing protein [Enterovirga sp.]
MRRLATALVIPASLAGPAAIAAESPAGLWLTEEHSSKIRIAPCGKMLCATIVWARSADADDQNPDPALRKRPVIGLSLSRDIRPDGKGAWQGSMYNPENGKTYKTTLTPKGRALEVGGCVLGGLLCGSETWERTDMATGSLPPRN